MPREGLMMKEAPHISKYCQISPNIRLFNNKFLKLNTQYMEKYSCTTQYLVFKNDNFELLNSLDLSTINTGQERLHNAKNGK